MNVYFDVHVYVYVLRGGSAKSRRFVFWVVFGVNGAAWSLKRVHRRGYRAE